jgi:hypothetical protein
LCPAAAPETVAKQDEELAVAARGRWVPALAGVSVAAGALDRGKEEVYRVWQR